ncbi:MAG: hypothetical protein JSR23_12885 [Proteobacteria bacterium]|nr:hypothetical protein [Pseudomonadota bacterium]
MDSNQKAPNLSQGQDYGVFLPMLFALLTLVVWFAFQTSQLLKERDDLKTLNANQEASYANAQKMRGQLDALAAGTARLAQNGNASARKVIDALKAKGISVNPDAATGK